MNYKACLSVLALLLLIAVSSPGATDPRVFELTGAKKVAARFSVEKHCFSGPSDPRDSYALEISFAPLSRQQFDSLTRTYGGSGFVPYSAEARYELSDFLPPMVQALIGLRFPPIVEEGYPALKESAEEFNLDSTICTQANCYSTVWEIVRARRFKTRNDKKNFCLFWEGELIFNEIICRPEFGRIIAADELQAGDAVLFFDRIHDDYRRLMHAAIFIDKGLYFEKTDSDGESAWRLVYFSDMQSKLQELTDSGKLETEFRRFNGTFPHPGKIFSVMPDSAEIPRKYWGKLIMADQPGLGGRSRPAPYMIGEVEIVIDQQLGRGIISPQAQYRSSFKELRWQNRSRGKKQE